MILVPGSVNFSSTNIVVNIACHHKRNVVSSLFGCRTTKIATSNDRLTKYLTMQNVDGVPIG